MAQQYDAEREELVNKICKMIQLQLEGTIGHIGQSPYTEMFFAVFEEVYRRGYFVPAPAFRGDNLLETIWARVRT